MRQHPLSAVFPPLPAEDYAALLADIDEFGQRDPIVLYEGMVLDGWHRYQVCKELKRKPHEVNYNGPDPVALVRSRNLHRRHLSASQRAAAVVALSEWAPRGANQHTTGGRAPGAHAPEKTTAELAKEAGTSERTIKQAKVVEAEGSAELKAEVHAGTKSVKQAAAEVRGIPEPAPRAPEPKSEPVISLAQYRELEDRYQELVEELETVTALRESDPAKEMNTLREQVRLANRRRDELMTEKAEMRKQLDYYQRELKKLGWKPKK